DDVYLGEVDVEPLAGDVGLHGIDIDERPRQAEHQLVRAPVGEVEMGVVPLLHHLEGIAAEVAEVILVGEAGAGDLRSRGELTHLGHFLIAEGTVEGLELVVLILAHGSGSTGAGAWGERQASAYQAR